MTQEKRAATAAPEGEVEIRKQLKQVDEKWEELDKKCVMEQMTIQLKFEGKKKPLVQERAKIIEKLPNFWARAILGHPELRSLLVDEDATFLLNHLVDMELEDNMDLNGSYKITMKLNPNAPDNTKVFDLEVLSRTVTFDEDGNEIRSKSEPIKLKFEDPAKDPTSAARKNEEVDGAGITSILNWFYDVDPLMGESEPKPYSFGEIFRKQIWNAPLEFYEASFESSDDEDDDDDEASSAATKPAEEEAAAAATAGGPTANGGASEEATAK